MELDKHRGFGPSDLPQGAGVFDDLGEALKVASTSLLCDLPAFIDVTVFFTVIGGLLRRTSSNFEMGSGKELLERSECLATDELHIALEMGRAAFALLLAIYNVPTGQLSELFDIAIAVIIDGEAPRASTRHDGIKSSETFSPYILAIMPRKYATRKKVYRKRRGKARLPLSPSTMPAITFRKLRYSQQVTLAPGALGGIADHRFVASGLYDPDFTGVGHQPRFFDQIMLSYDHFVVLGAKITVRMTNASTTTPGSPVTVAIALTDDSPAIISYEDLMEQGRVRSTILGHPEGSRSSTTLTKGYSAKKFFHRKPLTSADLRGTAVANPVENAYFHVIAVSNTGVASARQVDCDVIMEFVAAFTEPKLPPVS